MRVKWSNRAAVPGMPDHAPRARHDPPWLWDRARANALSVRDAVLAVTAGGLIATDALIPDGRWLPSHSLAMIPVWVQAVIAVLLVGGGGVHRARACVVVRPH